MRGTEAEPMSGQVSTYLRGLQSGKKESGGHFTLDPRRAREKMKKFQLTDPHRYVLMLAASAALGGATTVDCYNDADDLVLWHDGELLSHEELDQLFVSLFSGAQESDRHRRLRLLAIGLNAALGLTPATISLETWDGREGSRLVLTRDGEKLERLHQAPDEDFLPGSRVHVRERKSWRTLQKFFSKLVGLPPEGKSLAEGARHSNLAITVNERRVDQPLDFGDALAWRGMNLSKRGLAWENGDGLGGDRSGVGRFSAAIKIPLVARDSSRFTLVWNGVVITRREVDLGYTEAEVVLWHDKLRLNVSQSDVVEDEDWRNALSLVRAELKKMLLNLMKDFEELEEGRKRVAQRIFRRMVKERIRAESGWQRWRELKSGLLDLPIFLDANAQEVSLRPFFEAEKVYVTDHFWDVEPWGDTPVLYHGGYEKELVAQVFPKAADGSKLLSLSVEARRHEKLWLSRPPSEPRLARPARWLAKKTFHQGEIRGELGLDGGRRSYYELEIFKQERPLLRMLESETGELPKGLCVAVEAPQVRPWVDWARPVKDEAYAQMMAVIRENLEALYSQLPSHQEGRLLMAHYLEFVTASKEGEWPRSLCSFPLYPKLAGGFFSLDELKSCREPLGWLRVEPDLEPILDYPVVLLKPKQLEVVLAYLGRPLHPARADYERALAERDFLTQDPVEPRLGGQPVLRQTLEALDGEIGISRGARYSLELTVLYRGRPLARLTLPGAHGPVEVIVDGDGLTANPDFDGVVKDSAWDSLEAQLQQEVRALVEPAFQAWVQSRDEALEEFLWLQFRREAGPEGEGFAKPDAHREAMARLPFFTTVDRSSMSLNELRQRKETLFLTSKPEVELPHPVLLLNADRVPIMQRLLGSYALVDALPMVARELKLAEFRRRPAEPELALDRSLPLVLRRSLGDGLEGELGLLPHGFSHSRVRFYREFRLMEEKTDCQLAIPIDCRVNCDHLRISSDHFGVAENDDYLSLLARLEDEAESAVRQLLMEFQAGDGKDCNRYLVATLVRLWEQNERDHLVQSLSSAPLFRDNRDQPLTFRQLREEFEREARLAFLPLEQTQPQDLLEAVGPDRQVVMLDATERTLLRPVFPYLSDLTNRLVLMAQARRNKERNRVEELTLEARHPAYRWLVTYGRKGRWYRGEIGIPLESPASAGLELVAEGVLLESREVYPGPGFVGVIQGPFKPNASWDGVSEETADQLKEKLKSWHVKLLEKLIEEFPPPDHLHFPAARRVVLSWWNSVPQQTSLERQLEQLHILPLTEGRFARIVDLENVFVKDGVIQFCRPGQEPVGREFVILLQEGSWLERFLQELVAEDLKEVKAEDLKEVEASVPVLEREEISSEPVVPRSALTLEGALAAEFRLLGAAEIHPRLKDLETVLCQPLGRDGPSFELRDRQICINRDHPFVVALERRGRPRELLYLLLSGIFSVTNRELEEVDDSHEREFHARVLATLLGG